MARAIIALLALLIAGAGFARAADFQDVRVVSVYDGDTFQVTLLGVPPVLGENLSVRIRGIDAPEIRGKCDAEKALAVEARDALVRLLANAQRIDLVDVERGKYFRLVATVLADGKDVALVLIERKLGRAYDGGARRGWCDSP